MPFSKEKSIKKEERKEGRKVCIQQTNIQFI